MYHIQIKNKTKYLKEIQKKLDLTHGELSIRLLLLVQRIYFVFIVIIVVIFINSSLHHYLHSNVINKYEKAAKHFHLAATR